MGMSNKNKSNIKSNIQVKTDIAPKITLDEAYANGFTSKNKGGKCVKCGLKTMYKERTLCYRCYKNAK